MDGNDNVAVTGQGLIGDLDDPQSNVTTVKYGTEGQQAWAVTFSGTGFGDSYFDEGSAVDFDNDGNLFVAGYATMAGNATDYVVLK